MEGAELARRRMRTVGLYGPPMDDPAQVVRWFGALQSQDYYPAKWAVAQRLGPGVSDADLDHAFAGGVILRTHVLRPTWHFVAPADIRWILELTAPRVHALNAYYYRQSELDDALLRRATDLIAGALAGKNFLTRREIAVTLERAGIAAERFRLSYILMYAELERAVCSGPLKGKQHTYALLDERAAPSRSLTHDEALAELTRRYFTSHGPATAKDFSWWSSLTLADIATGLDLVGHELESTQVDGVTYWSAPNKAYPPAPSPTVHLLQPYDEYIVGYRQSKFLLDLAGTTTPEYLYNGLLLLDSQVAGQWKRTFTKGEVIVDVALHKPFGAAESRALRVAADAYGAFVGRSPVVAVTTL